MNTIRLFERDDTSFVSNGIGNLTKQVLEATVTEEVNGEFYLELKYPCEGNYYGDLEIGKIIVTKASPYSNPQAFRIARMSTPINGEVSITANHISYDLTKVVLKAPPLPQTSTPDVPGSFPNSKTAMNWIKAANTVPAIQNFTFQEDINIAKRLDMPIPMSVRAFLGGSSENSLINMYGGEFVFDNFSVRHVESRGSDKGVTIRYGKNLTEFTNDADYTETFTGVYPYYQSDQDGFMAGTVQYVLDESGQKAYNYDEVQCLDCTSVDWTKEGYTNYTDEQTGKKEWRGMPTSEMLTTYARKYIDEYGIDDGDESLTISFVELSKLSGYEYMEELEKIELGDIVKVVHPMAVLAIESECVATQYDAVNDKYISITIGERSQSFADTMVTTSNAISDAIEQTQDLQNQSDDLYIKFEETATGLQSEVTRAKGSESELSTRITQNADAITLEATNRQNGDASVLRQTAESIESEVTRATIAEGNLSSSITQNATAITTKVSKTDYNGQTVASLINQSATSVKIKANHIELDGNVVMKSDLTDGTTEISGDNIKTGTIDASLINTDDLVVKRLKTNKNTYSPYGGFEVAANGQISAGSGNIIEVLSPVIIRNNRLQVDSITAGAYDTNYLYNTEVFRSSGSTSSKPYCYSDNSHKVYFEWTGSALKIWVDNTNVATLNSGFTGSNAST